MASSGRYVLVAGGLSCDVVRDEEVTGKGGVGLGSVYRKSFRFQVRERNGSRESSCGDLWEVFAGGW